MSHPSGRLSPWKPWGILQQDGRCSGPSCPQPLSAVRPPAVQAPAARVRGLRSVPAGPQHPDTLAADGGGSGDLARCLELLRTLGSTAVDDAALLNFRAAADFADKVEEISRAAEYLQVVAAGAVDRTRREATAAARSGRGRLGLGGSGWVTGCGRPARAGRLGHGMRAQTAGRITRCPPAPNSDRCGADSDPADDGCRNAAEFLRTRLRISIAEARRRLASRRDVLPRTGFTGSHRAAGAARARRRRRGRDGGVPVRDHHHPGPGEGPAPRPRGHHGPDGTPTDPAGCGE